MGLFIGGTRGVQWGKTRSSFNRVLRQGSGGEGPDQDHDEFWGLDGIARTVEFGSIGSAGDASNLDKTGCGGKSSPGVSLFLKKDGLRKKICNFGKRNAP